MSPFFTPIQSSSLPILSSSTVSGVVPPPLHHFNIYPVHTLLSPTKIILNKLLSDCSSHLWTAFDFKCKSEFLDPCTSRCVWISTPNVYSLSPSFPEYLSTVIPLPSLNFNIYHVHTLPSPTIPVLYLSLSIWRSYWRIIHSAWQLRYVITTVKHTLLPFIFNHASSLTVDNASSLNTDILQLQECTLWTFANGSTWSEPTNVESVNQLFTHM